MNILPSKKGKIREVNKRHYLYVDGNALLKTAYHGAKNEYNKYGEHIGGIYQFMTIIRKLLVEDVYDKVFVFWDGKLSGKLRYDLYPIYKANRGKDYTNGTEPQDEDLLIQKIKIQEYLEEVFILQYEDDVVESDDKIAYCCLSLKENERATILSGDRDLMMLLTDNVRMYYLKNKEFITKDNFFEKFGFHYSNILLHKILLGDKGDNIKGVKGLSEENLFEKVPEFKEKKVTLNQVIERFKSLNEERVNNKKAKIKVYSNVENGVSLGPIKENMYQVNETIINLNKPLLTEECIEVLDNLMNSEIDSEGRDIKNLYLKMKRDGVTPKIGSERINDYLLPFKKLINKNLNV